MIAPEAVTPADALAELHQARRRNHRQNIHWVDALYRVYISGLGAFIATLVLAGQFPQQKLDAAGQADLVARGPGWLGLAFAVGAIVGLRSGARGGPLTIEAAAVQHELLAPVDRRYTLREPALKQLRFLAYAGLLCGGVVGLLGARQTEVNAALDIAFVAVTFAIATVLAAGCALCLSGHRKGIWVANGLALVLLGWSALDIARQTTTSPFSLLASFAFWPLHINPVALIGLVLAALVVLWGISGVGGTSLEQARRRAGLVSQLRFAVTLQDVRTVVLLRRQLAQERPRAHPWIRLRRGTGRLPVVWRRDWQSYFRYPVVRLVRMAVLAAAAGVAIGFTWRGVTPAFLGAALALYLAGYDAVEPIAQEIDHPTRWDSIPDNPGRALLQHLPAALLVMLLLGVITTLTALIFVPASFLLPLVPVLALPIMAAATVGAAVSTAMGAPNPAKQLDELGADMMGFVQLFRLILPPALVIIAMLPMLAAGGDAANPNTARVSNLILWPIVAIAIAIAYLMARRPSRL